jgi:lysophospholipase L1-like esterase
MSAPYLLLALTLANPFAKFPGSANRGSASSGVTRPATVAWYGDSITQGECSGTAPPVALDALLPAGYSVQNLGVSGESAHEIYERVASGAATACVGEPCGHYVVQGAVNTLKAATYAASPAAAVASVALNGTGVCAVGTPDSCGTLDSVDLLHANHPTARIFVVGVLPYAGCSALVCPSLVAPGARAQAYNAALATACASRAWLRCVSPYASFEDEVQADHLRASIACADGIHLEDEGSAELAATVYSAATW